MQRHIEPNKIVLRCQACAVEHDPSLPIWACPYGGLLDVAMPAFFPWQRMRQRPAGLWRFREALPLPAAAQPVSLGEMRTPLLPVEDRASRLRLKLDFLFPTGIKQAVLAWAQRGILMEPTSATALAASTALGSNHLFGSSATAVVPITGSGVKSAQRILI